MPKIPGTIRLMATSGHPLEQVNIFDCNPDGKYTTHQHLVVGQANDKVGRGLA